MAKVIGLQYKEIEMDIINIIFWIAIGLLYLGFTFQYQEILIGLCALIIGIVALIGLFRGGSAS